MNIGDHVRVNVRLTDPYITSKTGWKEIALEGTVVRGNPRLDPPDSFCLLTGDQKFPVSIIQNESVTGYVKLGVSAQQLIVDRTRYILVDGSKGQHRVAIHNSGYVACDCLGFQYKRKCRHQQQALQWLNEKHGTNWKKEVFK